MSESIKKSEIENTKNELESSISKPKHKHNSKRRRCKKNQAAQDLDGDSSTSEVDVLKFLSSALAKNESETSVEINPPVKIAKESHGTLKICTIHNQKDCGCTDCMSYSTSDLSNLLKNLHLESSSYTKFLNVDLSKKNKNGKLPYVKNIEKAKSRNGKKETSNINDEEKVLENKPKKHFNSNLCQKYFEKPNLEEINPDFPDLVPELKDSILSTAERINKKQNHQRNHSVVGAMKGLDNNEMAYSIKTNNKAKYSLEKKTLKIEISEKSQKLKKKKEQKENPNELIKGSATFDKSQKVFLNSDYHQCKDDKNLTDSTSNLGQSRKRQHSSKSSNSTAKLDNKFAKYLSADELNSLSNFGVLMSGIIRINQKNHKEAYISAPDKGADILIDGLKDRNRALEGDEVFIVLKLKELHRNNADSTEIQRTGVVVGMKTLNHNRGAIGTLNAVTNKNISFALFLPRDIRLPRIRIKKSNIPEGFFENPESFKDKLYYAKITQWNDMRYADGELIEEVGLVGNIEAETNALLLQYDLEATPYSKALNRFIPSKVDQKINAEIKNREDFRQDCVFTIDPATATDLDDAVSCKELPNGNYEIGVHISDVSYFLKEGTPLDFAVSERATTIYLVQRVYHMLPPELCRICSLTPGEDKLSFSVLWEVTPDCQIIKHRFAKTVINSCAQFSYKQVQSMLKGSLLTESECPKLYGHHSIENIKNRILFLHKMAVHLRSERFKNGALLLNQKKIEFFLDENKIPIDIKIEEHEESHQLIEEFMLLANITVAEILSKKFPDISLLRSHAPPVFHILRKLKKNLEKYDIMLDISRAGSIQESLMKYSGNNIECVAKTIVLCNLLAKPMARANYYCSGVCPSKADRHHYALNVPLYTHFTSPIRRYADIIVHRLLTAHVRKSGPPKWTVNHIRSIASVCNKQKYAAKVVNEMSIDLHFSAYVGQKGYVIYEAVVCDIKDRSFECILFSTGIHQKVYLERINAELNQIKGDGISRLMIKWPADDFHPKETVQMIELFSIVKLELRRSNSMKIETTLLRYG